MFPQGDVNHTCCCSITHSLWARKAACTGLGIPSSVIPPLGQVLLFIPGFWIEGWGWGITADSIMFHFGPESLTFISSLPLDGLAAYCLQTKCSKTAFFLSAVKPHSWPCYRYGALFPDPVNSRERWRVPAAKVLSICPAQQMKFLKLSV